MYLSELERVNSDICPRKTSVLPQSHSSVKSRMHLQQCSYSSQYLKADNNVFHDVSSQAS